MHAEISYQSGPVVRSVDKAIHRINHYSEDLNHYPEDLNHYPEDYVSTGESDFLRGYCYPPLKQLSFVATV